MSSARPVFISISLVSNRPKEFSEFLENIEQTAYDPSRVEVIVGIDDHDDAMQQLVRQSQKSHDLRLKFLSKPYTGFENLYKLFDTMHALCDPNAYFVQHSNDEPRFKTPHWDKILEDRYTGLFSDHIYRLRTSAHKLWNYNSIYDVAPHPENTPIHTKKWIDLTGWCPCHSADSFQQLLVYYLGVAQNAAERIYRDIPVFDIEMEGLDAGVGLETPEAIARYGERAQQAWQILFSDSMQMKAQEKANILRAHIRASALGKNDIRVTSNMGTTHVFDITAQQEIMTFHAMVPLTLSQSHPNLAQGKGISLCIYALSLMHRCANSLKWFFSSLYGRK